MVINMKLIDTTGVKPFLKWAGGKGQLLNEIRRRYPNDLGSSLYRYCEPFVGGGAVLFDILSNYKLKEVYINDVNAELINTYNCIKLDVDSLIAYLKRYQKEYLSKNNDDRKEYFYKKRDEYNSFLFDKNKSLKCQKAALFIFLNRTCFNGLYRVNADGLFNVPMGRYKNPIICNTENLTRINKLLKKVKIHCGDYSKCSDFINENTFVYIDPPYRPLNVTSSFTSYTSVGFADKEQTELCKFYKKLTKQGAKVLLSNSDPTNSNKNDTFFDDLYEKFNIERVPAKRMINCNGASRGFVNELLISNYTDKRGNS